MKKTLALILAAVLVLSLSVTAYATDPPTTGTITIENATFSFNDGTTSFTGNTYTAYRLFDATPAGDGDDQAESTNTYVGTVGYTVPKTTYDTYWDNAAAKALFHFTLTASGDYAVTLHENTTNPVTAQQISDYFNGLYATDTSASGGSNALADRALDSYNLTNSGSTGTGTATGTVPFGYYFITSTNGSVVSVDTTNKNVVIADKNVYGNPFNPTETNLKNITAISGQTISGAQHDNQSASIGDVVTYQVQFDTSNFVTDNTTPSAPVTQKITSVVINDQIGAGLDYAVGTVNGVDYPFTVTYQEPGGSATALTESATSIASQGATLSYYIIDPNTDPKANLASASGLATVHAFNVVIPWVDADGNPVFADDTVITLTYSAQLNDDIKVVGETDTAGTSNNKASVSYNTANVDDKPDPADPPTGGSTTGVTEDTVTIKTYAIALVKVDKENHGSMLQNAKFGIKLGTDVIGATFNSTDGIYHYDSTVTSGTDYTTEFTTDINGLIIIKGVKAGNYTATETAAPAGFNLMPGSTNLTAIVASSSTGTTTVTTTSEFEPDADGTYYKNSDDTFVLVSSGDWDGINSQKYKLVATHTSSSNPGVEVIDNTLTLPSVATVIENGKGTELPSTGGIGTTLFYVIGTILVLGAGVVLVARKRASN